MGIVGRGLRLAPQAPNALLGWLRSPRGGTARGHALAGLGWKEGGSFRASRGGPVGVVARPI